MTALAPPPSHEPAAIRPARKENRIVAFFRSRSRSRSRSHTKSSPGSSAAQSTTDVQALPALPASKLRISHARSTSLAYEPGNTAHASLAATASQSNSKPGTRTSTRPISSTTTATHSTITPLPSDSIRRRQRMSRHGYSHDYTLGEDADHQVNGDHAASHDDHDHSATRSDTPSSFNQRRKLELRSIFGISLSRKSSVSDSSRKPSPGSSNRKVSSSSLSQKEAENMPSRKRSFRLNSRPNTPKSTDDSRVTKTSTGTIPTPSNPLPLSASPRRLSFGLTSSSRTQTPMTSSGHLPLSRHKRLSVGSHDTAHDSAVALPDDHSDSAITSSSHLDTRSHSKTSASNLSHTGKSRKGKEQERDTSSPKPRSPTRKTSRTSDSRHGIFGSLSEEASPIIDISPPPLQNDSRGKYDPGGFVVSVLPTAIESLAEEDAVEQQPLIRAPYARPGIPRIIHTPPTPQRTAELDSVVRPATTPPRLSGGQGKPREVLLSQEPIAVHKELPKLHARITPPTGGDPAHNPRMRSRFSPRLFGGKDLSRESKKQKPGVGHDSAHLPGAVGPPRHIGRRIQHGSFDFERPVSGLNRSSSTVNGSLVKGEGLVQSRKTGAVTHRPTALERTASSSSDRTGKSRTHAYHPTRADSPLLAQLSANHTGETSVVSFSSVSASAQSKSTGKSAPGAVQTSSSWGRASGRRAQRTSHGPFPFEPAASVPNSPLPTSSALPRCSPSPHRQEFEIPEGPPSLHPGSPLRSEFGLGGGSLRDKTPSARGRGQQEREQGDKKGKGRSLDLKLGLSWAPNRVRQEAVMPGLLLSQKQEEERHRGKDVTKVFENVLSESGFETFKKYVHRFDAHLIPLEGPRGLLARVEKLLTASPISQAEKAELLVQFTRFVEGHSEV
ncbi:hypothetical protein DFH29DRAFT_870101 [Suillus ampliporus]|nr:hypothetical protein DFH29DRAFT_870101 [Suillus ampliporus]